jgi:hypothetical protein
MSEPETTITFKPVDFVTFIESIFTFSHELPSLTTLAGNFNVPEDELRQPKFLESINNLLKIRGLPEYKIHYQTEYVHDYDPVFIAACNLILDASSSKSFNARIKELEPLGVNTNTWNNWLANPRYYEYVTKMFNERFDKVTELHAKMALQRNIQAGDLQSIKYYNELTNKFRPQSENQVALSVLIRLLMEIVARHVPEQTLNQIIMEFDASPVGMLNQ